jgi:hypothetical protein
VIRVTRCKSEKDGKKLVDYRPIPGSTYCTPDGGLVVLVLENNKATHITDHKIYDISAFVLYYVPCDIELRVTW